MLPPQFYPLAALPVPKDVDALKALLRQGLGWSEDGGAVYKECGEYFCKLLSLDPWRDLSIALTIADGMGLTVTLTAGARTVFQVDSFSRPPRAGMALSKQSAIRFWGINQPHLISTNATLATMLTECMLEMLGIE